VTPVDIFVLSDLLLRVPTEETHRWFILNVFMCTTSYYKPNSGNFIIFFSFFSDKSILNQALIDTAFFDQYPQVK
jgi:hypothetical protein